MDVLRWIYIHAVFTLGCLAFHRLLAMRDEPLTYGFETRDDAGLVVLTLSGPLTLTNMFELQNELRQISAQSLIVDMSGVPYMDSAGLGLLMNAYVSAQRQGRAFALAGVNARVVSLLEMTRVHLVLQSFASVAAAEAGLAKPS